MAVGDRIISPNPPIGGPYSVYEVTDETVVNGAKQAAQLVKLVDDAGATLNPAAPVLGPSSNNIGDVDVLTIKGAASIANGQVTAGAASAQLVATRATRRSVVIRNTDASNSAYIGTGVVSAANGFLLKAGESISIDSVAAINCIRATADVVLAYMESYD